jgi:hypothetical protein
MGQITRKPAAETAGYERNLRFDSQRFQCLGTLIISAMPRPLATPPATVSRRRFFMANKKPKPKNRIQQAWTAQKRTRNLRHGSVSQAKAIIRKLAQ